MRKFQVKKKDIGDNRQKKLFVMLLCSDKENAIIVQVTTLIMKSCDRTFSAMRHGKVNKLNNLVKKQGKT